MKNASTTVVATKLKSRRLGNLASRRTTTRGPSLLGAAMSVVASSSSSLDNIMRAMVKDRASMGVFTERRQGAGVLFRRLDFFGCACMCSCNMKLWEQPLRSWAEASHSGHATAVVSLISSSTSSTRTLSERHHQPGQRASGSIQGGSEAICVRLVPGARDAD